MRRGITPIVEYFILGTCGAAIGRQPVISFELLLRGRGSRVQPECTALCRLLLFSDYVSRRGDNARVIIFAARQMSLRD